MQKSLALVVMVLAFSGLSLAWNCSDPLAERVLVPSSTTGTFGDADGQLALYQGQLYECEVVKPSKPQPPTQQQSQNQNQSSNSTSSATATGGNSTATGGNATGGSVSNSGNSSNSNKNTATGGAGGSASQTQSTSSAATNNGDGSNNTTSVTNIKPAAASAEAPVGFSTAPCLAAFGGGAQAIPGGFSFGASRTDKGCDSRMTAILFLGMHNPKAAAKVLCSTKASKRAKLTLEECLEIVTPAPQTVVVEAPPAPAPAAPVTTVTVIAPQPEVVIIPFPTEHITVQATKQEVKAAQRKPVTKKRTGKPCVTPKPMEK